MAAKEMYDYLSTVTPDYSATTLSVSPQNVLTETVSWKQNVQEADDGTEQVLSLGGPFFNVQLQWDVISDSDAGTVFDFFSDSAKGKGFAQSFKWTHPTDGHTYVVKFRSNLKRVFTTSMVDWRKIDAVDLKVIGRIADA
jgi:hypothetical protein